MLIVFGCSKSDDVKELSWKTMETPTTKELTDIYFSSNSFGVACGSFGTLLKTDDAGETWQNLDVGVVYSFSSVFVLAENEFFTSRIGLYKTINSGVSFNETGDLGSFGSTISDIHFFNSQKGIIDKGSTVYLTSDGGNNWIPVYPYESYARILEVTDNNTVYLAGGRTYDDIREGELHKSLDNGETWEKMNLPGEIDHSQITAIDFLSNQTGYISTFENKVYKTIDGGENWIMKAILSFGPVVDLLFLNENDGYLISHNKIYVTKDGGAHWHEEYQTESETLLTSIAVTPNGTLYVSGLEGTILKRE